VSQKASRKKRKQRRHTASPQAVEATPSQPEPTLSDRYARSRERDEAARAALKPLAPGERPRAVTIAAIVTALLGITNLAAYVAGMKVGGQRPNIIGLLLFTGLMLAAAWGAWNVRYWAVLGIQALLGLTVVIFSLLAIKAESIGALAIAIAFIGAAGTLFWFLVKCMARIQMPQRPGAG